MVGFVGIRILLSFIHLILAVHSTYVYYDTPVYYRDARMTCDAGNGKLVVLDSLAKSDDANEFLTAIKGAYPSLDEVWFGMTFDTSWEKFIWPDESEITWTNWDASQPSGYSPSPYPQLCGRSYRDSFAYRLSTTYCRNTLEFACESASGSYTFVNNKVTYRDALNHCIGLGLTLLKLDSMAKVTDFSNYMDVILGVPSSVDGMWVCLTYDLSLNTYFWLDTVETQKTTFDYWSPAEPDSNPPNSGDIPNICGFAGHANNLKWTMDDCRQNRPFVCEYDSTTTVVPSTITEISPTTDHQTTTMASEVPRVFTDNCGLFRLSGINEKPMATGFKSLTSRTAKQCILYCAQDISCSYIHFNMNDNLCYLHDDDTIISVVPSASSEIWERN